MDKIGIVINKKAKNAASLDSYLKLFQEQGLLFDLEECEPDQLNSAIEQSQKKHAILLIGGGDGSIRSAAQHCVHSNTVLGILPLGTLNHFAKELGLPQTPEQLFQAITHQQTAQIDVAEVNGEIFLNNSSLGFYPKFAQKRDYYHRFYNKWLSYIPGLIEALKKHDTFFIDLNTKDLHLSLKTSFLMISNNLYSYEFPLSFARESFNQSQLGIYFFKHGKLQLSKIIRYFLNQKTNFEMKHATSDIEIQINGVKELTLSLDGETKKFHTPLIYKCHPKSLTVFKENA